MPQQPKTRVRAFSRRTRAGCLTCKVRRKKCDEQRPICNRCKVGGFICDGYEADKAVAANKNKKGGLLTPDSSTSPLSGTSQYSPSLPLLAASSSTRQHGGRPLLPLQPAVSKALSGPSPPRLQHSLMLPGDPRETHFYTHFFTDTVGDLVISHVIGKDFWRRLLQSPSQQFESVRHAVVALGAVHWQLNRHDLYAPASKSSSDGTLDTTTNQFALRHYNDAISALIRSSGQLQLQPKAAQQRSPTDIVTMVTCCFLFVLLESMRGDYTEALRHLESGITILADHNYQYLQPTTASPSTRPDVNTDEAAALSQLAAIFHALACQVGIFATKRLFPDISPICTPMKKYTSRTAQLRDLDEAEDVINTFDDIVNHIFLDMTPDWENPGSKCVAQWENFKSTVTIWKSQFDELLGRLICEGIYAANLERIVNLRLQYKMWLLMVEVQDTAMTGEDENEETNTAGSSPSTASSTGSTTSTNSPCTGANCTDDDCGPEPADLSPAECNALLDELDQLWYSPTRPRYGLKVDLLTAIYQLYVYCQDEDVRLRIIRMLRARKRREIIWDSDSLADFLEKDMARKRAFGIAARDGGSCDDIGDGKGNAKGYSRWPDIGPSGREEALVVFRPKRQI